LEEFPELLRSLSEGTEISISCEWRVLRFNNETRQSVAKVLLLKEHNAREPLLIQIPNCLAFECKCAYFLPFYNRVYGCSILSFMSPLNKVVIKLLGVAGHSSFKGNMKLKVVK
jgi:hypothetical protein